MKVHFAALAMIAFSGGAAMADDYGSCYYDGSCNGAACCVGGQCVYSPGPCETGRIANPAPDIAALLPKIAPEISACRSELTTSSLD